MNTQPPVQHQNLPEEPIMEPEQAPEPDKKTVLKAITTGLVFITLLGFVVVALQDYFAGDNPEKTYRDIADAQARIVPYVEPRPVPDKTFSLFVPQDRRTSKQYEIGFENFKGKPMLLAFWATWCHPCVKEMQTLDNLYDEFTDAGLHIVPLLTSDKSGVSGARYFFNGQGIKKLPLFLDHDTTLMQLFQVRALPIVFFIDPDGKILGYSNDLDLSQAPAQDLLRYFTYNGTLPK